MSEIGAVIAGKGSSKVFRDAPRIVNQYGGSMLDWVKKSSSAYTAKDGLSFEAHWVENIQTGLRVEFKTKFLKGF